MRWPNIATAGRTRRATTGHDLVPSRERDRDHFSTDAAARKRNLHQDGQSNLSQRPLSLVECAEAVPCCTSQTISVAGSESVGPSKSSEELRVSLVVGGLVSEVGLLQLDGLLD